MGYTHYWYQKPGLDVETFMGFGVDVEKIVRNCGVELREEFNLKTKPVINELEIRFNGVAGDGHETFFFQRDKLGRPDQQGEAFSFCKTAQKPYDVAVCAVLIAAKAWFGSDIKVSSDGDEQDWEDGLELAESLLGYTAGFEEVDGDRQLIVKNPVKRRRVA